MKGELAVVIGLSNGVTIDDLQWPYYSKSPF